MSLIIHNVVEISDTGESIVMITETGSLIHLPMGVKHSIVIMNQESDGYGTWDHTVNVAIDLYEGCGSSSDEDGDDLPDCK